MSIRPSRIPLVGGSSSLECRFELDPVAGVLVQIRTSATGQGTQMKFYDVPGLSEESSATSMGFGLSGAAQSSGINPQTDGEVTSLTSGSEVASSITHNNALICSSDFSEMSPTTFRSADLDAHSPNGPNNYTIEGSSPAHQAQRLETMFRPSMSEPVDSQYMQDWLNSISPEFLISTHPPNELSYTRMEPSFSTAPNMMHTWAEDHYHLPSHPQSVPYPPTQYLNPQNTDNLAYDPDLAQLFLDWTTALLDTYSSGTFSDSGSSHPSEAVRHTDQMYELTSVSAPSSTVSSEASVRVQDGEEIDHLLAGYSTHSGLDNSSPADLQHGSL